MHVKKFCIDANQYRCKTQIRYRRTESVRLLWDNDARSCTGRIQACEAPKTTPVVFKLQYRKIILNFATEFL